MRIKWKFLMDSGHRSTKQLSLFVCLTLTLLAQSKHVETTFDMIFMRFFVSCMTWSTFTNVAAFPTVGSLTVNWSVCTYVGTLSNWSRSSFLGGPAGTFQGEALSDCFMATRVVRLTHLIWKLSDNFVQTVGLFSKILGLREQILSRPQTSLAFRKLIHRKGHRWHVLGPFYNVIIFVIHCTIPFVSLGVHLVGDHFHFESALRNLFLFFSVQSWWLKRLRRCSVFLLKIRCFES